MQTAETTLLFETLKNVISDETVKKLLVSLLRDNKCIINDYLSTESLYHVYMRQEDPYVNIDAKSTDIHLIISFATLGSAIEWVLKNGRDHVITQEDNYGTPIVLTIIKRKNKDIDDIDYCHEHTNMNMISVRKYTTYAFSEQGYKMLLNEHKVMFARDWCDDIVPDWIYWIKDNDEIVRGCDKEHILDLVKIYREEYQEKYRQIAMDKYDEINGNTIIINL